MIMIKKIVANHDNLKTIQIDLNTWAFLNRTVEK